MKKLGIVFNFEFSQMIRKKTVIITTLVISIVAMLLAAIPLFMTLFSPDKNPEEGVKPEEQEVAIIDTVDLDAVYYFEDPSLIQSYTLVFGIEGEQFADSKEEVIDAVEEGQFKSGFIVHSSTSYTIISNDKSIFNQDQMVFEETMRSLEVVSILEDKGIDSKFVFETMTLEIQSESIILGKDASQGLPIAYAILFIMYLLILLYGTNVSTSVAREKDSRTMELLITSTKPNILIMGKVLAAGLMGVLQVFAILLFTGIGFFVAKSHYPQFIIDMLVGQMTLDVILVYILFSISGYFLYLFIYAAMGSLVSKVEDVSSAVTPITWLFVLAYFAASIAMQMPDNPIVVVTSFIPFVSLFTMPIRFMLTSVSVIELSISLTIMFVTCFVMAKLSIYIYRFGSLNYGNRLKLKDVFQSRKVK